MPPKKQRKLLHSDYFTSIFNFSFHLNKTVIGDCRQSSLINHMSVIYARETTGTNLSRRCKVKEKASALSPRFGE